MPEALIQATSHRAKYELQRRGCYISMWKIHNEKIAFVFFVIVLGMKKTICVIDDVSLL